MGQLASAHSHVPREPGAVATDGCHQSRRRGAAPTYLSLRPTLGPFTTPTGHPDVIRELYDSSNLTDGQVSARERTYIIGRKGSGKTAFLHRPLSHNNVDGLFLDEAKIYSRLEAFLTGRSETAYAAYTAEVWAAALWVAVINHLAQDPSLEGAPLPTTVVWRFACGSRQSPHQTPHDAIADFFNELDDMARAASRPLGIDELLKSVRRYDSTLQDAVAAARQLLRTRRGQLFVLVDNLEELNSRLDILEPLIAGLLKFAGKNSTLRDPAFKIRCCFPAEIWPRIRSFSSNQANDIGTSYVVLRWHSRELFHIVGNRLYHYNRLYSDERLASFAGQLRTPRVDTDTTKAILTHLLGDEITNANGQPETGLGYVLRHTQLLPRQFIILLNEILAYTGDPPTLSPDHIAGAIRRGENTIRGTIVDSYKSMFPKLSDAIKILSNVPRLTTVNELHKHYNTSRSRSTSGLEWIEFLDAMSRIGALGLKTKETSRYVIGMFSYTLGADPEFDEHDEVCVHPLFSNQFGSNYPKLDTVNKPIYPYGTGIEDDVDDDYRKALGDFDV